MKTLRMVVDFEYDDQMMHDPTPDSIQWFREEILGDPELILHSNEVGDEIGSIRVVSIEDEA